MGGEIMAERRKIDNDMSDNTGMVYFPDCKGCVFAAKGNKITPGYTKSVCDVYPKLKPIALMNGGQCEYYDEADE
jgi:hypothetical protein